MNVENIDFVTVERAGGGTTSDYVTYWLGKGRSDVTELRIHNFGDLRSFPTDERGNVILVKE